jgi:hypothetical protein
MGKQAQLGIRLGAPQRTGQPASFQGLKRDYPAGASPFFFLPPAAPKAESADKPRRKADYPRQTKWDNTG